MECAFLMPRYVWRIEVLKAMKLCKCGLDPEHIFYGGEVWLKKIFSGIIAVPVCLKEGVLLPVYKGKVITHFREKLPSHNMHNIHLEETTSCISELL